MLFGGRGARQNIFLLTLFNLFVDFKPYAPFNIIFFTSISGSFTFGMLVFSISSVSTALCEVPTGMFSDVVGRRKTMLCGSMANIAGIASYAMAYNMYLLVLGAVLLGLGRACFSGTDDAFLFDSLKIEGRELEFPGTIGKTKAMLQIGLALSALLGGFISLVSLRLILWISVIPQVICLLLVLQLSDVCIASERQGSLDVLRSAIRGFLDDRRLRVISLSSAMEFSLGEAMYLFMPAFVASVWPLWATGIMRTISHTLGTIGFLGAGRVISRLKTFPSLIVSQIGSRFLGISACLLASWISPLLICLNSLLYGLGVVSQQTLLQEGFTDGQRATMGSLNSLLGSLLFSVTGTLLGYLADSASPAIGILCAECLLISALIINVMMLRRDRMVAQGNEGAVVA